MGRACYTCGAHCILVTNLQDCVVIRTPHEADRALPTPTPPTPVTPSPATSRLTWIQPRRSPSPSGNEPGSFLPQDFAHAVPSAWNAVPQTCAGHAHSHLVGLTLSVTPSEGFPLHPFLQVNLRPITRSGISRIVFVTSWFVWVESGCHPHWNVSPLTETLWVLLKIMSPSGLSSTCHLVWAPQRFAERFQDSSFYKGSTGGAERRDSSITATQGSRCSVFDPCLLTVTS